MRLRVCVVVAIAACANIAATAALAGPSMTTRWKHLTISQKECTDTGSQAVRAAGFTKNFEVVGDTVFGELGDYTAAVVCATAQESVFFVVSGPSAKMTGPYTDDIADRF